jgi:hypothetical protein
MTGTGNLPARTARRGHPIHYNFSGGSKAERVKRARGVNESERGDSRSEGTREIRARDSGPSNGRARLVRAKEVRAEPKTNE